VGLRQSKLPALLSGARVIALLSNHYRASEYTEAECLSAVADDPLNTKARLIVLRIDECKPRAFSLQSPTGTWCRSATDPIWCATWS
jgi:hypothetical protein